MIEIFVNSISKKNDEFDLTIKDFIKMSSKFAKIHDNVFFNSQIAKSQSDKISAIKAYDEVFLNKKDGFCVALDADGKNLDSFEFAKILDKNKISFFIGGAFGLSQNFKQSCDYIVSLSRLTFSHKIAKLMLFEQIFRGLCINANHPYHK